MIVHVLKEALALIGIIAGVAIFLALGAALLDPSSGDHP